MQAPSPGSGSAFSKHLRLLATECVLAEGAATVSAAHHAAATAGLEILAKGGNAFDAALAAALVETVTLPMKCGLAGDVVAIVRRADGKFEIIQAVGAGASALDEGAKPTITGPRSVGVPGAPHGYAMLAERGLLPLSTVAAPAIALARGGFRWSSIACELTKEARALLQQENGNVCYLPGGNAPELGDEIALPGLADLLEAFVEKREELFFGEIGARIASRVQQAGGFIRAEDFRHKPAIVTAPDAVELGNGITLMTSPAPTHGARLSRLLKETTGRWDDPVFLLRTYLADQKRVKQEGTSLVTSSDREGNVVVLIHSNSFPQFGSGLVVEPWQLVLSNRPGRGFSLNVPPEHSNAPKAGRIPRTTLHVWGATAGKDNWLGATPGGANQAPWNFQVLSALFAGERRLDRLVTMPLWGFAADGTLEIEADHPLVAHGDVASARGRIVPPLSLRSVEQIVHLNTADPRRACAADPRTGARSLSWLGT